MVTLIPAYRPAESLVTLVTELRRHRPDEPVLVVDDGSGPEFAPVMAQVRAAGAEVVAHAGNLGKGAALRTGVSVIRRRHPRRLVVCADADGQHAVADILAVADEVAAHDVMVLGVRAFDGTVPLRSRFGNALTRRLFQLATGRRLTDTQTGLRGYPAHLLGWLTTIGGDRYEYELSVLLRASREGIGWRTIDIRTIYADGNATSHFRPVADSVRIYLPLLAFTASSLLGFGVDTVALLALHAVTGSLGLSVVGARLLSGSTNFLLNRRVVFRRGPDTPLLRSAWRYAALAVALLGASYLLLVALTRLGLPLLAAKVLTEVTLFLVSFTVQRRFVFDGTRPHADAGLSTNSQQTPRVTAGP